MANGFQGPPAVDFYSMLSGLGDTIAKNRADSAKKEAYANALTPGPDGKVDFGKAIMGLTQVDPHAASVLQSVQSHNDSVAQADRAYGHTIEREKIDDAAYDSEHALAQRNADREFALKQAAANEGKFAIKEITNPDGTSGGFTRVRMAGPEGPITGTAPPPAPVTDPTLSGPDYLKTLSPDEAILTKKLADHEILPTSLSIAGGHRERMIAKAARYDPSYDAALAPGRFAAMKEFMAGGPNSPAATIVAGGTTIAHLKHASDVSEKLGGPEGLGPVTHLVNQGREKYMAASDNPDLKEYNGTLGRIAEEGTKFYRGVGGTESDINRDIANMSAGQSSESRSRALATQAELMYGKVIALQDRYRNAMGKRAFEKFAADNDFPVISRKNVEAVNVILERGGKQPLPLPPEAPSPGRRPVPNAAAINALKMDTRRAAEFDALYGAGAARAALGGGE